MTVLKSRRSGEDLRDHPLVRYHNRFSVSPRNNPFAHGTTRSKLLGVKLAAAHGTTRSKLLGVKLAAAQGSHGEEHLTKITPAERRRRRDVKKIRSECTSTEGGTRGRRKVRLTLDHQSFTINGDCPCSAKHAWWLRTQLAIALQRFKYGADNDK